MHPRGRFTRAILGERRPGTFKYCGVDVYAMPAKKGEGFHSAAGLIRYFDQEDEKALKVPPWLVVVVAIALGAIVLIAQWQWPA